TSAPWSARSLPAYGPATPSLSSTTLIPRSGWSTGRTVTPAVVAAGPAASPGGAPLRWRHAREPPGAAPHGRGRDQATHPRRAAGAAGLPPGRRCAGRGGRGPALRRLRHG